MKVSLKLSLKLSGDIWNFHEIFTSYMKLSWKFHYMHETLKLSLHAWHFHEHFRCELKVSIIFHWNFHVATESFSETFSKLSANFDKGDFSIKQVHEEMYAFCFNIYQKQMDHNSILRTMCIFLMNMQSEDFRRWLQWVKNCRQTFAAYKFLWVYFNKMVWRNAAGGEFKTVFHEEWVLVQISISGETTSGSSEFLHY